MTVICDYCHKDFDDNMIIPRPVRYSHKLQKLIVEGSCCSWQCIFEYHVSKNYPLTLCDLMYLFYHNDTITSLLEKDMQMENCYSHLNAPNEHRAKLLMLCLNHCMQNDQSLTALQIFEKESVRQNKYLQHLYANNPV